MSDREDLLRVDVTGTVHPVGRIASQQLRSRSGEWRLYPSPRDVVMLRAHSEISKYNLRVAGEITMPGALCDIVALIAQSAWHGEMVVLEERGARSLFFDRGALIAATTTVPEERLGETLYRFGVVTREQVDAAVQAAALTGKRFGEAAIELDFVSAEELYPMMARQAEEVFYGAIHVGFGMFYFFDGYDDKGILQRHNLNAGMLLMEGARRMDEMRFFREKIPTDDYLPVVNATVKDKKTPPDDVAEVFAQVDGRRSIAEIGRRIGQLEFEVTRAVFQLVQGGFVHMVAPRPRGPEAITEAFNPALIGIHSACDAASKGPELRDGLARFATGGGVYDPLFSGAGPLADGSFNAEKLARNLVALAGEDPDAWLMQLLNEYVGFALFHAGSLLSREIETALAAKVGELLKSVRVAEAPSTPSQSTPANALAGR